MWGGRWTRVGIRPRGIFRPINELEKHPLNKSYLRGSSNDPTDDLHICRAKTAEAEAEVKGQCTVNGPIGLISSSRFVATRLVATPADIARRTTPSALKLSAAAQ